MYKNSAVLSYIIPDINKFQTLGKAKIIIIITTIMPVAISNAPNPKCRAISAHLPVTWRLYNVNKGSRKSQTVTQPLHEWFV